MQKRFAFVGEILRSLLRSFWRGNGYPAVKKGGLSALSRNRVSSRISPFRRESSDELTSAGSVRTERMADTECRAGRRVTRDCVEPRDQGGNRLGTLESVGQGVRRRPGSLARVHREEFDDQHDDGEQQNNNSKWHESGFFEVFVPLLLDVGRGGLDVGSLGDLRGGGPG